MDFLGFWGAVVWLNRAFFSVPLKLGCESGIIDGVLEPYAFLMDMGNEDSSFSMAYDNRSFDSGVYCSRDCYTAGNAVGNSGAGFERISGEFLQLHLEKAFEMLPSEYDVIINSAYKDNTERYFEKISENAFEKRVEKNSKTAFSGNFAADLFLGDPNIILNGISGVLTPAVFYGGYDKDVKGMRRVDKFNLHEVDCGFDGNVGYACIHEISRFAGIYSRDHGSTCFLEDFNRCLIGNSAGNALVFMGAVDSVELCGAAEKEISAAFVKGYERLAEEAVRLASKAWKTEGETGGFLTEPVSGVSLCNKELRELRKTDLQENFNCFTSAEIKIDMSGNGATESIFNIDELARQLSEAIGEAMANISEGVHDI